MILDLKIGHVYELNKRTIVGYFPPDYSFKHLKYLTDGEQLIFLGMFKYKIGVLFFDRYMFLYHGQKVIVYPSQFFEENDLKLVI